MKRFLKKTLVIILTAMLTLSSLILQPLTTYADDGSIPSNQISSTFEFFVGNSTFFYDDGYFNTPASEYDDSFATTSLCLAMSAFNNPNNGYKNGARCAEDMMEKMGFSNIEANGYYEEKPSSDSMGAVIGSKEVTRTDGKIQPIIVMALRGGNYESEWAGNVTIGSEKEHQGFSDARDIATIWLNKYLRGVVGKYSGSKYVAPKIWIVGYSRASATANLTGCFVDCAILDEGQKSNNTYLEMQENLNRLGVTTDDVYVYCFEVPQGLTADAKYNPSVQSNIWCLANPADPVPYVAPSSMGFYRAGTTVNPAEGVTYDAFMYQMEQINKSMAEDWANSECQNDYQTRSSNIINILEHFFAEGDFNIESDSDVGENAGEFCENLINDFLVPAVQEVPDMFLKGKGKSAREIYTEYFQAPVQILAKTLMGSSAYEQHLFKNAVSDAVKKNLTLFEKIDLIMGFDDLIWGGSGGQKLTLKLGNLLSDILKDVGKDNRVSEVISRSDMQTLQDSAYNLAALVACMYVDDIYNNYQYIATAKQYAADLFLPHYPEYVLAYMRAHDVNYIGKSLEQYQLEVSSADGKPLKDIQLNIYVEDLKSPYEKDRIASITKDGLNTNYEFSSGWWSGSATYEDHKITLYLNRDKDNNLVASTDFRFEIVDNNTDGSRQNLKIDYNINKNGEGNNKKTEDFEKTSIPITNGDVLRIIPNTQNRSYASLEKYITLTPVFVDENLKEIENGEIISRKVSDGRKEDFTSFLVTGGHKFEITPTDGKFLSDLLIPAYDELGRTVYDENRDMIYTRHVDNPANWDIYESSMPLYIVCNDRYTDGKAYADITYQHASSSKKLIDELDTTIPLKLTNKTKGSENQGTGEQYIDAEAGDIVEVSFDKNKIPSGKVFNGWSIKSATDVEKTEDGTKLTFTMPEGGAEVHAMLGDKVDGVTLTFTGSWAHPTEKLPDTVDGYWKQIYIDPAYTAVSFKNAANYYPVKHIYQKMDKDHNGKAWIMAPEYSSESSGDMVFDHWEAYYTDTKEKCTDLLAVETYFDLKTESYVTQMVRPDGFKEKLIILENIKKSLTLVPVYVPAEYDVHIRYSTRSQQTLHVKAGEVVTITDRKTLGYVHDKWIGYYNPLQEMVDKYGNVTRSFDTEKAIDMGEHVSVDAVYTFTMPKGDVYVTATDKLADYEVNWISDGIKTTTGSNIFHWNDMVYIVPDNIPHSNHLTDIKVISGLENMEDVELVKNANGDVVSLKFQMEASDVELEYTLEQYPAHNLKLIQATAEYGDGREIIALPEDNYTVYQNDIVLLKAVVPDGFYFKEWKVLEGGIEINSSNPETYILVPDEDLTIEAVLGEYTEIDQVDLEFTSTFAGNQLTPESAFVNAGGTQVQEESVDVEQVAEFWQEDPLVFGFPYEFEFYLTPEEGYYFGTNSKVTLEGKECTVSLSNDGSVKVHCNICTDPATVTEIEEIKGLEGVAAHTSLADIQNKMPKVGNAYVEERRSWIQPEIKWDWDNLEDENGEPFVYDETSSDAQEFFVPIKNLDFSRYMGELLEYYDNGLVISPDIVITPRAKVTVVEEEKIATPYVSSSEQPGSYSEDVDVTLACDTEDALIYFLTDVPGKTYGAEEIYAQGTLYEAAISLKGTEGENVKTTIYTVARSDDGEGTVKYSETAAFNYSIEIPDIIDYYAVIVINGRGSGIYPCDRRTVVGIKANKRNKGIKFIGFTLDICPGNPFLLAAAPEENSVDIISGGLDKEYFTFHMPEDNVRVVANYEITNLEYVVEAPVAGKELSGEVGESQDNPEEAELLERGCGYISYFDEAGNEQMGTAGYDTKHIGKFTVRALPEGFAYAEDLEITVNGTAAEFDVLEDGSLEVTCAFDKTGSELFELDVVNGTAYDAETQKEIPVFSGVSELYAGTKVQITADEIEGKVFAGWEESSGTLTLKAATEEFVMPADDITITAIYKDVIETIDLSMPEPESPDWILAGRADIKSDGLEGTSARTKWTKDNKNVASVDAEGTYMVSIEVNAAEGFVLSENATANLNGKPCRITVLDDGQRAVISLSYEAGENEKDPDQPDNPVNPDKPDSPDTGDHNHMEWYLILLLVSLLMGIFAGIRRHRSR